MATGKTQKGCQGLRGSDPELVREVMRRAAGMVGSSEASSCEGHSRK